MDIEDRSKYKKDDMVFCTKCRRTMKREEFYQSNNWEKYPDGGTIPICKKCLTMGVNNFDPSTYLWILQELDVPYIPDEWEKLLFKYGKDKKKLTGATILGRYVSKMRLTQYRKYRWADTQAIQDKKNRETEAALKAQGMIHSQIEEIIQNQSFEVPKEELKEPEYLKNPPKPEPQDAEVVDTTFGQAPPEEDEIDDLGLSDEEVLKYKLKWGKAYKPYEWVWLEQYCRDMENSFDIQSAAHKDTLKKLAKTSLAMDKLIDIGDVDGYQKMSRVYNDLMRNGKFTAAQNKEENGEYVDSVSELVMMCELDGFIPKFYHDKPNDKVDRVLQDLQEYTRSLIEEETNIGQMIESSMKLIQEDKEREANGDSEAADDDDLLEEQIFSDDAESFITDGEFQEFNESEEEMADADAAFLESELAEDDK